MVTSHRIKQCKHFESNGYAIGNNNIYRNRYGGRLLQYSNSYRYHYAFTRNLGNRNNRHLQRWQHNAYCKRRNNLYMVAGNRTERGKHCQPGSFTYCNHYVHCKRNNRKLYRNNHRNSNGEFVTGD